MNDKDWRRLQMTTIYKFDKVEQHTKIGEK